MKAEKRIVDENEYMDKISDAGDAVKFVINCTTEFTDKQIKDLKKSLELEAQEHLRKKHKLLYLRKMIVRVLHLEKLNKFMISLKIQGPLLVFRKIIAKITNKSPYVKPYL
jgi:hypothetical protein